MTIENDLPLSDLAEIEAMSVRAINICYYMGLTTLGKIIEYYKLKGSFTNIRNCGQRTENELTFICKKYLNGGYYETPLPELPFKDKTLETIEAFNPFKKAALNRHIEYLVSTLNVRAKNGIMRYFGKELNTNELIEKIYSEKFSFNHIDYIGQKSTVELQQFKQNITAFIETLQTINDNQLSKEYTKLIIKTSFKTVPNYIDNLLETVFDINGKIKLFSLIKVLIDSDLIFNDNEKQIFYYCFTQGHTKTLQEVAESLNISKERARQIKVNLEGELKSYFQFILNLQEQDLPNYGAESKKIFLLIDDEFSKKINDAEEVNFVPLFYSSILSLFLEKTHSIFGDDEILSSKHKLSSNKKFCNCYLIENNVFHSYNFSAFVDSVNEILNERITEDYYLHFEGYISQFTNDSSKKYFSYIKSICENIIFNEFDLVVNAEGYLIFERNKKKQLLDYVVRILEDLNEMTKIENIFNALIKKYPDLEINEQSVRSTLNRDKELFIYIGRTSTYGLRKWQDERENLKGGTIRDIVEEFLNNKIEPQHISQIIKYVRKYRNTNENNVMSNLSLEENSRFQFFPGDFLGLKGRHYQDADKLKRASGSHFRAAIFKSMNGWDVKEVINYFVTNFHYHPLQVKSIIEKKIDQGELIITSESKLKI